MDIRGRDKDMDAGTPGLVDRPQRRVDVFLARPREAQHRGIRQRLGNPPHRLEVARRRRREAGLNYVDVEPLKLARDRNLLLDIHRAAGRLLAVAQRRVEDPDVVRVGQDCRIRVSHRTCPLSQDAV